ncbi:hypothetical protein, partial [Frankia sp. AgKG'84/4]|uniref:hypothetical protein n=1 Tax=Frankia sp. AgKG'84/4 TaxID=573490 RepID=UPI00202A7CFB
MAATADPVAMGMVTVTVVTVTVEGVTVEGVMTVVVMAAGEATAAGEAGAGEAVTERADPGREVPGSGREAPESGDLAGARERLARGQSALVAALVAGQTEPATFDPLGFDLLGFDPDALAATRRVLLGKRREGVACRWPILAAEPNFAARFLRWADGRPPAGAWADGLAFGRAHRDALSERARV